MVNRFLYATLFWLFIIVTPFSSVAASHASIAYRWAPIHYQDVDQSGKHSLRGRSDFIAEINFDGDWIMTNNWQNADRFSPKAACYYSVVETVTHYFIVYAFFHPRDWSDWGGIFEHENDMEGLLAIVQKDGKYGQLWAAITVSHLDFYSFIVPGSPFRGGRENIDGKIIMQEYEGQAHPTTMQEANGHGLKAWNGYE